MATASRSRSSRSKSPRSRAGSKPVSRRNANRSGKSAQTLAAAVVQPDLLPGELTIEQAKRLRDMPVAVVHDERPEAASIMLPHAAVTYVESYQRIVGNSPEDRPRIRRIKWRFDEQPITASAPVERELQRSPAEHYFECFLADSSDSGWLHSLVATKEEFGRFISHSGNRVVRRNFIPLADAKRFHLIMCVWADHNDTEEDYRTWLKLQAVRPAPTSLVAIPASGSIEPDESEYPSDTPDLVLRTREAALSEAARRNAIALAEGETGNAGDFPRWWAVVEVSDMIQRGDTTVDLSPTGIGIQEHAKFRVMRLVEPTEEELAAYPLPAPSAASKSSKGKASSQGRSRARRAAAAKGGAV
jgi:hypothetical protein